MMTFQIKKVRIRERIGVLGGFHIILLLLRQANLEEVQFKPWYELEGKRFILVLYCNNIFNYRPCKFKT